jgi:hypothetical protein
VPPQQYGEQWARVLDTSVTVESAADAAARPGDTIEVRSRSVQVLLRG